MISIPGHCMTDEPAEVQVSCLLLPRTTRYADRKITSLCSSLPFIAHDIQAAVSPTSIWIVFKAVFHKEKRSRGERTEIKDRIRDVQRLCPALTLSSTVLCFHAPEGDRGRIYWPRGPFCALHAALILSFLSGCMCRPIGLPFIPLSLSLCLL